MNVQFGPRIESHDLQRAEGFQERGAIAESSPRLKARIAGSLYLMIIVGGIFAVGYVPSKLIVPSDAAATAQNILTNEPLYRLGLAVHMVIALCNIPLATIFYDLFKVANRSLARAIVFFILVAVGIESFNLLNQFAPLVLLHGQHYASAMTVQQLQAQVYIPLQLQDIGFNISLAFVGCYCLSAGYLIFRSGLLPRTVGLLLAIGGAAYVINSFANFLAPTFAAGLFPYIQLPSLIGEGALCLSLLFGSVNLSVWAKQDSV